MRIAAVLLACALLFEPRAQPAAARQYRAVQNAVATGVPAMRGAALVSGRLYTWGDSLTGWNLASGARRVIARSQAGFGEGGCADGRGGWFLQDGIQSGPLVAISPSGKWTRWDPRVEMHDCNATTLLGRRGVLITDHYGQVRFYEGPDRYREIYSFYTASRQSGLAVADVDRDGRVDIFCGNYWIRSPEQFELPWRLFAINTRHETPDSATVQIALRGRRLFAAQGHMAEAFVSGYTPGPDPTQIWKEEIAATGLHHPHAILSIAEGVLVGENNGPGSTLMLIPDQGPATRIATTNGFHTLLGAGGRVLAVGPDQVVWLTIRRRK